MNKSNKETNKEKIYFKKEINKDLINNINKSINLNVKPLIEVKKNNKDIFINKK